jgi:Rieske Fe-S protein
MTQTQTLSQTRAWSQIIATAWADAEFKARLLADPRTVLAEHGIDVPEGFELVVVEDTETVKHLMLPASPAGELADEELVGSAGADSYSGFSGWCHHCGCHCHGCRD